MAYDLIVTGGGIVGMASAWRILQRNPGLKLLLLEKEAGLARHQTGRNSGVLHSGIYYRLGSFKAELCREGYSPRCWNFLAPKAWRMRFAEKSLSPPRRRSFPGGFPEGTRGAKRP